MNSVGTKNHRKRYLIYDNIVRGAGIGHTMASYNYGLDYARRNNLEWMPRKITAGHRLGHSRCFESELGLPIISNTERDKVIKNKNMIEHVKYNNTGSPPCWDFTLTGPIYRKWYHQSRRERSSAFISPEKDNICISIRRGDLANNPDHPMWYRLSPLDDYVSLLNKVISQNNITDYRLIISTDLVDRRDTLVDRYNNPKDISVVFNEHLSDIIFLPFCESDPIESQSHHTFDFFHNCIAAQYFIGSHSGFSNTIRDIYRTGNSYSVHIDN